MLDREEAVAGFDHPTPAVLAWGSSPPNARQLQGVDPEKQREGQNHQLRVEQDEHAGVVEAPFAVQAAGSFDHAPEGRGYNQNLPGRGVKGVCARKAFEKQTGCERPERQNDPAKKRLLTQPEDVRAW